VLAESLRPATGGALPAEAVTAAVAITDYVIGVWRALPGSETLTLSHRDWALSRAVDQLADWLERHGGHATRRELQAARVAGARTAQQVTALLLEYEQTYPGSVRDETAEERVGKRGPAGQVVSAPRREHVQSPDHPSTRNPVTVDGNSYGNTHMHDPGSERTGQHPPGESADTGNRFDGNSYPSTVSATQSSGASRQLAAGPGKHRKPR
jgi:hypothetical protein